MLKVSNLCHFTLNGIKSFVTLADDTLTVAKYNVLNAHIEEVLGNGNACCACAVHNHLNILKLFANEL